MGLTKSVLLWGSDDILGQSIKLLLAESTRWTVIGVANRQDVDALMDAIETHRPEIVVIPRRGEDTSTGCPCGWLFESYPAIKIITISQDDNSMDVYSRHNYMIHAVSDLINLLDYGD